MLYEIRNMRVGDLSSLKELWHEVFLDNDAYIDRFFSRVYISTNAYVAIVEDKPVAMMFMIPSILNTKSEKYPVGYIYAVATNKIYRGHGIMKRLEEYACDMAKKQGISALALVPASKSLFKLYEKLGYTTAFYKKSAILTPMVSDKPYSYELLRCTADCFTDMRSELLKEFTASLEFDENAQKYRYEALSDDNDLLLYKDNECAGYIVGHKDKNIYTIMESNLDIKGLSRAANALTNKYYKLKKIMIIGKIGRLAPYGMMKALDNKIDITAVIQQNPYMNLMLE